MSVPFNPCGGMAALHRVPLHHLSTCDEHPPPISRAPSSGPSQAPVPATYIVVQEGGLDTALSAPMQGLTLDLPALAESLSVLPLHEVLGIEVEFLQGCELPSVPQISLANVPPVRADVAPPVRLCMGSCTMHCMSHQPAWPHFVMMPSPPAACSAVTASC